MRGYFVPQQGEKHSQCGTLASISHEVEVQKYKHVEYSSLAMGYKSVIRPITWSVITCATTIVKVDILMTKCDPLNLIY
jgi:hypothetical protein